MREKFVQKLKKLAAKGLPLIIAGSMAFGGDERNVGALK